MTRPALTGSARLLEVVYVRCPYDTAQRYLAADMRENTERARTMTLRVPLADLNLSKNVVVTFAVGTDPMHMDQPWRVHWTPETGGPYPDFHGELTVRADEDWNTSILELKGEYVPPGGSLGRAFDRVLGKRIASATAQSLLTAIGQGFESRYREQEDRKHAAPELE
jgi:hypothetical protein